MDGEEEQRDQYEERLKEVFQSFDGSGDGSLNLKELAELCNTLQLNDTVLHSLHTLLETQDQLDARVEFEQFKNALILVLSSTEEVQAANEDPHQPESPEVQPRFVKGTKRYGRRSTPEFTSCNSELGHTLSVEKDEEEASHCTDGSLPIKRERWNDGVSTPEEYEADGQLHLWNPDEPATPRSCSAPLSDLQQRFQTACQQLSIPQHGTATIQELHTLCQHLGLEIRVDALQSVDEMSEMSVQEFVSYIQNNNKPPTPSASTPYRQLKRLHSIQPFDEMGRRISFAMSSTIGLQLFSDLDDGTGHTAVELLLDAWLEDGINNCTDILQALDFALDGKLNLSELTAALENELMTTKNSIHKAALASFKAEIRYLLERLDQELREKKKLRTDLEKLEKLKSQLASEVDEHHIAIERINDLNLRKLEEEYKERMAAMRLELSKEVESLQQHANEQREQLEREINKIREDETFLKENLTLKMKENSRLEAELLDSTERLMEAEAQLNKLQKNLDNVLKEKFGDLDPNSAEFYQQEERLRQMRITYEEQCRELQDRIDELQAQLEEFRVVNRAHQVSHLPSLADELDSKSPGMDSDPGLGSEEGQAFNMSLEAEMILEQLKENHSKEIENVREQLDSTVNECQHKMMDQATKHEEEKSELLLHHQKEIEAINDKANAALAQVQNLQDQLEQEINSINAQHGVELEELHAFYKPQMNSLMQELQDSQTHGSQLEEQQIVLAEKVKEVEESKLKEIKELCEAQVEELSIMEQHYKENLDLSLQKERESLQSEAEKRLIMELGKERQRLEETYKEMLRVQLEELQQKDMQEAALLERRLQEKWEEEKREMMESNKKSFQDALEVELARMQVELERRFQTQWDEQREILEEKHRSELQHLQEEQMRLQAQEEEVRMRRIQEWEQERGLLQEQHEHSVQVQLEEQRRKLQAEREEQDRKWQHVLEEKQGQLEKVHRAAMLEFSKKHGEEREKLSCMLEKLRTDITEERNEAGRLAEENCILRQKISELREEDLRENKELLLKVEKFQKERDDAQKMAEDLKHQISECKQLDGESRIQSLQNAELGFGDHIQHRFKGVSSTQTKGSDSYNERSKDMLQLGNEEVFSVSVSRTDEKLDAEKRLLRAELNRCAEKMAQLRSAETQLAQVLHERRTTDKHYQALCSQLIKTQEKVQTLDLKLQGLMQQNSRLKSDLRIMRHERDSLKQEVISLHNATEKHGKRVWKELSGLKEAELSLLREENQRLQRDISDVKAELSAAKDKCRQLEALLMSVKQQKLQNQTSLAKAAEQERAALKRELEILQSQLHNKLYNSSEERKELESLQEENESLRNKQTIMEAQLMEAQLIAMLPQSPLRLSGERRGQHHADDLNQELNVQDAREMALMKMEKRMREVELTLRNVKLLLQEKVSQLKEQLTKNSKADVLLKDLYVENTQLLKALEVSEQRHKVAEKKNYLLEEKISSLNKIVQDLGPSPLTPVPFHLARSWSFTS